jgi:hypothetical protein
MPGRTNRFTRFAHPALPILVPVLVVSLLLAACAGGAGTAAKPAAADGLSGEVSDQSRGGFEAVPDPGGSDTSYADLADRQIVKTGEITIRVSAVPTTVGTVRAMALELGGYVGGSSAAGADEAATLTLRIPADRFDAAIGRLHELDGEVIAEATREEDVTGQVVDLDARIRNLQASEAQYRALLQQATKIEDILTVQGRLDDVRGQIEQLQGQLDQLSNLADLATLTVTLVPDETPISSTADGWDAGAILESAVAALVGLAQAVAAAAIWLVILGIPLALLAGLVVLIGLRLAPGLRRRRVEAAD